ncbi:adenosylcobinamide-GDP ribazoletransferase [Porphyromonadaceae bacterium OttesenSCG-928-L07]|nr:adenosylcobinamide-GDP ribazoletransferase [Porphyromonadaceae bacterium OttesenSCG-928-L07]MDL2252137.1 adenosylcobinamide-GDP ribazoletransferase [Odoribacter sp. OttesenSCG-928-J03]MDL2330527.1 adenosylcobinamide-GDP ribazoletransferase [Odoribacter sp. OttesenSCG-928-A06]
MKHIYAAFLFFTRLPFWRLKWYHLTSEDFNRVINYWALTGLLTGGITAGILWLSAHILPYSIAVILAFVGRLLTTGALHEDGLADFFDGFGGGTSRERTLEIMKDSHIGTYGVLSLIIYFALLFALTINMPLPTACIVMLVADPFSKFISSFIIVFLPYARNAETSKAKTVYSGITPESLIISAIAGLAPMILLPESKLYFAALFPILIFTMLIFIMKRKIQGYTGDCCGAVFLLCEISFYLGISVLNHGNV